MLGLDEFLKNISKSKTKIYIVLCIGIIVLIVSNVMFSGGDGSKEVGTGGDAESVQTEEMLEKRLKQILEKIQGAGDVDVMVTYDSGKEKITVCNYKSSKEDSGDSGENTKTTNQTSSENQTVMVESGTDSTPFISKEINPKIRGVLVVSEGANNENVKTNVTNAVAALLDVPYHRIQVLPKQNK